MKLSKDIENSLIKRIIDGEYTTAKADKTNEVSEFESYIDLLDSIREPKMYDWQSDIRVPEFVSRILTQSSIDANQYFTTRDFVETYLEDEGEEAKNCADSAKELINRTLNQKHMFYYQKYIRARILNYLAGYVFAKCWWEKKYIKVLTGYQKEDLPYDMENNPVENDFQIPEQKEVPIYENKLIEDRFNFELIDPRNIFIDNKYTYSIQQKDWIIIRSEQTYDELFLNKNTHGYFNLDKLKNIKYEETEISRETYNRGINKKNKKENVARDFDIIERYGLFPCKVLLRDSMGYPVEVIPAYKNGEILDDAEWVETIITFAVLGNKKILIRFQATPYVDYNNNPYKPFIRGLCYIHPTNDNGMGDAKNARELQLAIDDTVNISNDRVLMATMPIMKVKKYEAEDNPEIYIAPGHKIPLENPREDLEELKISDNIQGAMNQFMILQNKMNEVLSIYPTTMGSIPAESSTTATAIAGSEQRTNIRTNYKALTFENTFLTELYDMILQMSFVFADNETRQKLMGEKVKSFDPSKSYYFKPVSQAIEDEYSKTNKIKLWTQILGYISNMQHPDTPKLINYILTQIFTYTGDEFVNFSKNLLNPQQPILQGVGNVETSNMPTSNQNGGMMSSQEQIARGM